MNTGAESIMQALTGSGANAQARQQAYAAQQAVTPVVASVTYTSGGQVLVIGTLNNATAAAAPISGRPELRCVLLITDSGEPAGTVSEK